MDHKNERLRHARTSRNWTQAQLAAKIGFSLDAVRTWERGSRGVSLDARKRLCEVFGMTAEELGLQTQLPTEAVHVDHQTAHTDLAFLPDLLHGEPDLEVRRESHSSITHVHVKRDSSLQTQRGATNRHRMIQRVRSLWITGVLKNALDVDDTLITLNLQERPDALMNPWISAVQETNLPAQPLPSDVSITQLFDESGELLILGEPGSGKTTLLLTLVSTLLERAEEQEDFPIPVIFNLSSWGEQQPVFQSWLIEELNRKYQVPRHFATSWVEDNHLLLLLDGLDEVAEPQRPFCITAINTYRDEHGMVPMVICSRNTPYFEQSNRMLLNKAVVIQPLTIEQIDQYIVAKQLKGLQTALQDDPVLQEVVSTPLMLSTLARVYQGKTSASLPVLGSAQQRRHTVLESYVNRVLQRGPKALYPPEKTKRYLSWLAQQMRKHNQFEFYIDRLQPSWLPDQYQYRNMLVRIIFCIHTVIVSAVFSLFRGDSFPMQPGLFYWLGGGQGNSLLGWMAPGIGGSFQGALSLEIIYMLIHMIAMFLIGRGKIPILSSHAALQSLSKGAHSGLFVGGSVGTFSGIIYTLVGGVNYGLFRGIGTGLFVTVIVALVRGLRALFLDDFGPSSLPTIRFQDRLRTGITIGLCAMGGFGTFYAWQSGGIDRIVVINTVIFGFCLALFSVFGGGTNLIHDLGGEIQPAELVSWRGGTWQSVQNNIRKGLVLGLLVALCLILVLSLSSSIFYGLSYGVKYGIVFGLMVGALTAIIGVLTGILTDGWSSSMLDTRKLAYANEGIHRSLRNALFAACLFGVVGGSVSGVVCALLFACASIAGWSILGTGFAIATTASFALHFFTLQGGNAYIAHYLLRYYLWRMNFIPWKYEIFLDYVSERILLRKVGGGYIFMHRLLLDYFADKE